VLKSRRSEESEQGEFTMLTPEKSSTWQSAAAELARLFRRNRPLAGPGIILESTGTGIRISNAYRIPAGGEYRGYFKVTGEGSRSAPAVTIRSGEENADAGDAASGPAGFAVINDAAIEVPAATLAVNLDSGVVCASFELLESGATAFHDYRIEPDAPPNGGSLIHFVLASFRVAGGNLTVTQQQHGRIYGWIFRECDEGL
jgi:hypothetical protein